MFSSEKLRLLFLTHISNYVCAVYFPRQIGARKNGIEIVPGSLSKNVV